MAEVICSTLDAGLELGCITSAPGVADVYLGNFSANTTTWTPNTLDGSYSAVTVPPNFVHVGQLDGTAHWVETGAVNALTKAVSYTQTLSLMFANQTQEVRDFVNSLRGSYTAIVELEGGEFVLAGETRGLRVSASVVDSGIGVDDETSIRVDLSARSTGVANLITAALYNTLT